MIERDTIFALSSGRPPAAVSIIRVSGPKAHQAAERISGPLPGARMAALRELRNPESGDLLDEGLVLRFDGPSSATGENVVEFQCHGGRAVVDSILGALAAIDGLREAFPGEFTRIAFENGRIDLTEAEGLADLIEAETEVQRKAALALAEGGLKKQIDSWRKRLIDLSARVERAIDYDEEDEGVDLESLSDGGMLLAELRLWLERPRVETLKDGVKVVVAGPPNSGKSSLVNAIAGTDKAIVTPIPGTTRDQIEVPLALAGLPFLFIDTAGLRDTADTVEAIGVARATALLADADILLWLGEGTDAPTHPRLVKVHGQADRPGRENVPEVGSLPVSATTGSGLPELLARVVLLARDLLPVEGAVALNRRQAGLIAEAADALEQAGLARDLAVVADGLRRARSAFDRLTGRAGVEDVLDALFSRFCLGK